MNRKKAAQTEPKVEVVNRQRFRQMDQKGWVDFVAAALRAIGKQHSSVRVAFVSDKSMQRLNKQFRNVNRPTDVLSFPSGAEMLNETESDLGDIAISVERATAQAKENRMTFEEETSQLILHGLLHLCGYDHETDNGKMNRIELKMRGKLGI